MKLSLADAFNFKNDYLSGRVYDNVGVFKGATVTLLEVTAPHPKVRSRFTDRVYLVLEGEGEFIVNVDTEKISPGDVLIVPKRVPYEYRPLTGELKLYEITIPAFTTDDQVLI